MKAAFETPACNDHLPKSHCPSVNFHIAFLLQHTRLLDCRIKQVQVTQSHEQKASQQATNKLLYLCCFQNMSSYVPLLFHTLACAYADHSLTQTILLLHVFFLLGACTAQNPIHMCTLHVHVYTNTYTGQRLSVGRLLILQKYTRIIFEDFLPKIQLSQCRGIITNSLLSPQERRSSAVSLTKQTSPTQAHHHRAVLH